MASAPCAHYLLNPGHLVITPAPLRIGAMLGSCVLVALWDRRLGYGGAAHFCQPRPKINEPATARHGNAACVALVKAMHNRGSRARDIVAVIAGGAHPASGLPGPGNDNVLMARHVLKRRWITVASEDCGGTMGRRAVFQTNTGELAVHKLHEVPSNDWHRAETRFYVRNAASP